MGKIQCLDQFNNSGFSVFDFFFVSSIHQLLREILPLVGKSKLDDDRITLGLISMAYDE